VPAEKIFSAEVSVSLKEAKVFKTAESPVQLRQTINVIIRILNNELRIMNYEL